MSIRPERIGRWPEHLPVQLEIVRSVEPAVRVDRIDTLVFYLPDAAAQERLIARMAAAGVEPTSQHPYWQANDGVTYHDVCKPGAAAGVQQAPAIEDGQAPMSCGQTLSGRNMSRSSAVSLSTAITFPPSVDSVAPLAGAARPCQHRSVASCTPTCIGAMLG